MRWRIAHIFREVELKVSRFLLGVTALNVGVGVAVALSTWALGLPSPLLWGMIAMVLNYIPYVGQAIMILILLAVGFATQTGLERILAPTLAYMVINLIEAHLLFPTVVGRLVSLNPFLVFISIAFWIWAWGPFGGLMAVPSLLIVQALIDYVLPSTPVRPKRPVRRTANMTENDLVLANAAKAIKEQAQEEARAEEEAKRKVEEEKARAEEEKRKAQEEKAKAEEEKRRAEEARRAAETAPAKPAPRRRRTTKAAPATT